MVMMLNTPLRRALIAAGLAATLFHVPAAMAETVRWVRSSDAATLDPHSVNTGTNINVSHQIYAVSYTHLTLPTKA